MTIYMLDGFVHIFTRLGEWMWTWEARSRFDGQLLNGKTLTDEQMVRQVGLLRAEHAYCLLEEPAEGPYSRRIAWKE